MVSAIGANSRLWYHAMKTQAPDLKQYDTDINKVTKLVDSVQMFDLSVFVYLEKQKKT